MGLDGLREIKLPTSSCQAMALELRDPNGEHLVNNNEPLLPVIAQARGASFGHETIPSQANKSRGIFSVTTMMGLSSNIIR